MATMRERRTVTAPTRKPEPALKERAHALDVPFAMRAVATSHGARWDADHGAFVFRGARLPEGLAPFRAQRYSWEASVERELNGDPAPAPSKPTGAFTPRPHQAAAIRAITAAAKGGACGFLLADDVGLGKTISAWASVQKVLDDKPAARVLVVVDLEERQRLAGRRHEGRGGPVERARLGRVLLETSRAAARGDAAGHHTSPRSSGHPSGPAIAVTAVHPASHRRAPRSSGHARTSSTVIRSTF
jgi:hypothetical protein